MQLGKYNVPIWVMMLVVLVLSLIAWTYIDYWQGDCHYLVLEILSRLFEATAIASILGATIDGFLKVALVRDVFEASLGYFLPEELKPELKWIYDQKILCMESKQEYFIKQFNTESAHIEVKTIRRFKNVSKETVILKCGIAIHSGLIDGIDDRILEFGYRKIGAKDEVKKSEDELVGAGQKICVPPIDVSLYSGEEIETWSSFIVGRRLRDDEHVVFSYPSKEPMVSVHCENDIKHEVTFAYGREPSALQPLGNGVYRLYGVLLPMQHVHVKWWKDKDI